MKNYLPDRPGILAPPPFIFLVPLGAGLWFHRELPLPLVPQVVAPFLGWPLIAASALGFLLALHALHRVRTSINPYRATTAIAVQGIYRFTRNPIYLADVVAYVGVSLIFNALWPALLLPVALVVVQQGVIAREEAYLERKFGEEYLRYKARVRRWI